MVRHFTTWPDTWMHVAQEVAKRSKCSRMGIGAVIVDPTNRIVATGYNGPPANMPDIVGECVRWCPRAKKDQPEEHYHDCFSIHAEANALLFCDRRDREGGAIYVSGGICIDCAKLIGNSGLSIAHYIDDGAAHRKIESGVNILKRSGITVVTWSP